jgi:formiminoglutamase
MLNNWLSPVSPQLLKKANALSGDRLGKNILLFDQSLPDLKKTRIAIVGIDETEADKVRASFYKLSFPFRKDEIADLGNIRKNDNAFLIPVIEEVLSGGIIPVLIGKNAEAVTAQYFAYQSRGEFVNLAFVDEMIDYDFNSGGATLNKISDKKSAHFFNLSFIGFQTHFVSPKILRFIEDKNYDCVRLGMAKSALDQLEPVIRDADLLSFNLSSLKQSEAPGVRNASPNGFFAEEACQISRYAGMSEKLSSIGFYGFDGKLDRNRQTAQVVAQLIWYFIDGFYSRKNDFPVSSKSLTEYVVESKLNDLQVRFWKSTASGRWWMQVPVKTDKKLKRHRMIPCSYNDYQLACQEDIPDRLLNAVKRFV